MNMETNQPIIDAEAIKQLNDYINQYQAMRNLAIDSMVKTLSNLPNHNNELELEDEVYVKPNHSDVVKITSVRILEDGIYVRDEDECLHYIDFFSLDDIFEIFKQFQKALIN